MSRVAEERGPTGKKAGSPAFSCLRDLLATHSRTAPKRDAILAPGRSAMTYRALWTSANNTLRGLRSIGVGRGDRVAVALPDGPESAVTSLSIAASAVCVPLNPAFTADECQRYFTELGIAALLTRREMNSPSRAAALALGIRVLDLPTPPGAGFGPFDIVGAARQRIGDDDFARGTDDAFILLTSGSTSRPKMVPLTHAAVCLSARNVGAAIALEPRDRLLSVLPLFHGHGLISGILGALAAGSSVVCTSGFEARAFFDWLKEFRPTWYTAVPLIHQALLSAAEKRTRDARRSSLRVIRSASSTLAPKVICGLESVFGVPVIDTFGMTEAATQIAANPLGRRKLGSVGQSAGAEIAILDGNGRRLSPGEHGEIALRGPTITRGYYNNAEATRSAFRDGWFRTGDVGYLDAEGYLFIVGRIHEIINRGGQKIAPAEVEEVLLRHPDVAEAAVFAVPHTRLGADVAAAVVLRPRAKVSVQQLRDFVRERQAAFRVPGPIWIVPQIPKGAGGKLKRSELAAALSKQQPAARVGRGKMTSPRSELERQLAAIWQEILDCKQIGIDQDVFALGVDSLAVTQMILSLRERFGVELSLKDIFEAPTVAALATRVNISARSSAAVSQNLRYLPKGITRAQGGGPHPVAIMQERGLRIERELPNLSQFNLPYAYRLKGPLNVAALEQSFAEVVRRHESLRTGFDWKNEQPVSLVTPNVNIKFSLTVKDLAARAASRNPRAKALLLRKAELEAEREALKPFDLKHGPLFRVRLFRLNAHEHILLLVLHEIIVDGWSIGILMEEVSKFYAAFSAGKRAQVAEPEIQFLDFVYWQRQWCTSAAATRQFVYWKKRLQKPTPLFAATNNDAGGVLARIAQEQFNISNYLVARLKALSHGGRATLFMTLLAAFKTLLLARTGHSDICLATAMANRLHPGTERVIGPFATTTLIRTRLDADLPFEEALNRVRDAVLEASARQGLPFEVLVARLAGEDSPNPALLVQAYFVLQVASRRPIKLPDLAVRPLGYPEGQPVMPLDSTWLTMTLTKTPSGMVGTYRYKYDLFEPDAGQHWIADYKAMLADVAANPKKSLGWLVERLGRRGTI